MKRFLPAVAALAALLVLPSTAAAEFDSCTYDAGTHTVSAALSASTTGGIFVGAGGAITSGTPGGLSNAACGAATVTNTDTINLSGDTSLDQITVDTSGGAFAPGFTAEGDGASDIEIFVDLGAPQNGDIAEAERVKLIGTGGDDDWRIRCEANGVCGETWINLNGTNDSDFDDVRLAHPTGVNSDQRALEMRTGGGNDTVKGTANTTTLNGLNSSQNADRHLIFYGGPGNDTLVGGTRNDDFRGDAGNDSLDAAGAGVGAFATGKVDYSDAPGSVTVTSAAGGLSGQILVSDGFGGTDTLTRMGGIIGSPQADNLKMPDNPAATITILNGGDGDDTLTGGDAPDAIAGGEGSDTIDGKDGFTTASTSGYYSNALDGGPGNDAITDGAGPGSLTGGAGNDTLTAGPGKVVYQCDVFSTKQCTARDVLYGGPGNDSLNGGPDDDLYRFFDEAASAETDTITEASGEGSADELEFGFGSLMPVTADLSAAGTTVATEGARTVNVAGASMAANLENLTGTGGPDTIKGNAAVNRITSYGGVDTIDTADAVGDTVDCGSAIDLPTFDTLDTLKDCDQTGTGQQPTPPGGDGGGGGGGDDTSTPPPGGSEPGPPVGTPATPADPTAGVPTACIELPAGNRTRTKAAPGGGSLLLQVSQADDPLNPLVAKISGKGKAKVASVGFTVNRKPVTATGTSAKLPIGSLKIGKRNQVSATVTVTGGKKVVVSDIVTPRKCTPPPVTCKRLDDGARIQCSSSVPNAAKSVKVTLTGQPDETATGTAKPKKGRRSATYSLTMRPSKALPAGKYVYKQVATTSGKGHPTLLVVRVITLA